MRNVKLPIVLLLVAVLTAAGLASGCAQVRVTGSGNVVSRTFDLADFSKVRISYGFTGDVQRADSFSIEVAADDNLSEFINVEKDGDTLVIGMKPGSYERSQLQASVKMPGLTGIELTDGGRTAVSGFNSTNDLAISLSDGTHLTGSLTAGNVDIFLKDGSQLALSGSAGSLKFTSHDGSDADLANFTTAGADLNLGDGGTLSVNITDTLNVDLSSGAHVNYTGNPAKGTIKVSSGATLNKVD